MGSELATTRDGEVIEMVPARQVGRLEGVIAAIENLKAIRTFVAEQLKRDLDYGVIPGTGGKPTLYLPGAQKICMYFDCWPSYEVQASELGQGHVEYVVTTRLMSRASGAIIGSGLGSCTTMEKKYRERSAARLCPRCGADAIIRGKEEYGGGWLCFGKKGGCGAKFRAGDDAIEGQAVGKVENPDIYDTRNTVLKMAKKRCLGGNTPLLVKTESGTVRTDVEGLWAMRAKSKLPMLVPGVRGGWREVLGMTRERHRGVNRINLRDGSYIHASGDHRFPTSRGLIEVSEMREGDSLLRSKIFLPEEGGAREEYGWLAGLYLAEGSKIHKGGSVRYTLNVDEMEFAERIKRAAEPLGSRTFIAPRESSQAMDVNVYGHAYAGLMAQFIDGESCYTKHPSRYSYRNGEAFLSSLLNGYLAGDGHKCKRSERAEKTTLGFTGKNYELAYDLRCICAILDLRICLKRGKAKAKGIEYPTYTGWIKSRVESYNQADLEQVVSIERENREAVLYDIEVDGDHLFCLANGIQTHNSQVDASIGLGCLSELFTQDIEDFYDIREIGEEHGTKELAPARPQDRRGEPRQQAQAPRDARPQRREPEPEPALDNGRADHRPAPHEQAARERRDAQKRGEKKPYHQWLIEVVAKTNGFIATTLEDEGLKDTAEKGPCNAYELNRHILKFCVDQGWTDAMVAATCKSDGQVSAEVAATTARHPTIGRMIFDEANRYLAAKCEERLEAVKRARATSVGGHDIGEGDAPPPPRTAKALREWAAVMEEEWEVKLKTWIGQWTKSQGYPARGEDWTEEQVLAAYDAALMKLDQVGRERALSAEEAGN